MIFDRFWVTYVWCLRNWWMVLKLKKNFKNSERSFKNQCWEIEVHTNKCKNSTKKLSKRHQNVDRFLDWFLEWFLVDFLLILGSILAPKSIKKSTKNRSNNQKNDRILDRFLVDFGPTWPPSWGSQGSPWRPISSPLGVLIGSWGQDGPQTPPRGRRGPILDQFWMTFGQFLVYFSLIFDWFWVDVWSLVS